MTSLAERMREAANTIEEFNQRLSDLYTENASWRPSELRREAGHLDAEERAREELIGQLAMEIFNLVGKNQPYLAEGLIKLGWHK